MSNARSAATSGSQIDAGTLRLAIGRRRTGRHKTKATRNANTRLKGENLCNKAGRLADGHVYLLQQRVDDGSECEYAGGQRVVARVRSPEKPLVVVPNCYCSGAHKKNYSRKPVCVTMRGLQSSPMLIRRPAMPTLFGRQWTPGELRQFTGHMNQLAGMRAITYDDSRSKGLRAFEVWTGTGLTFHVLADCSSRRRPVHLQREVVDLELPRRVRPPVLLRAGRAALAADVRRRFVRHVRAGPVRVAFGGGRRGIRAARPGGQPAGRAGRLSHLLGWRRVPAGNHRRGCDRRGCSAKTCY